MSTTRLEFIHRIFIILTIISLLVGSTTFAQEGDAPFIPSLPPSPEAPPGTVSCFDYYAFGSVQADLSTVVSETVPGVPLTLTGKLTNNNPYPVVNGSLWVKIFKTDVQDESNTKANGYPLVAFFEAGKDIQIAGNSSTPYTFEWQVPLGIQGGTYEADFFFVTDDRFNLLGLSFTDDVTGNKTSFAISDTINTQVTFDKHKVTLNKNRYNFAAFPPHFTKDEPVIVEVPVTNPSAEPRTISLTWQLYNWDGLRSDFLLDTFTDVITLKPKETKTVTYTASKYTGSVSYIIATLDDQGTQSIINPRFVRDDVAEVRLNFPSLMAFPLEAGKEQTLFSCAHMTSDSPTLEDNTITMTLKDLETNNVIHTYTYRGGITGAMMGVKDTFTPEKAYGKVSLTTELKHGDTLLDTVTQTYDCDTLNVPCPTNATNFTDTLTRAFNQSPLFYLMVIVVSLGLLVYILHINRRDNHVPGQYNTMPSKMDMKPPKVPPLSSFIFILITAATFTMGVGEVGAVTWTNGSDGVTIPTLGYYWNNSPVYTTDTVPLNTTPGGSGGWAEGLRSGTAVSIKYAAKLFDVDTGVEISNNSVVSVNQKIRVERDTSTLNTDISWNGTGASLDSPYGRWVNDAGPVSVACRNEDNTGYTNISGFGSTRSMDVYTLLNVAPPNTNVFSNNLNASCIGNICTVQQTGPISIGMRFEATYGRFYYRYYNNYSVDLGCHANNVPMRTGTFTGTPLTTSGGDGAPSLVCTTCANSPTYTLYTTPRSVTFALTAQNSNTPPSPPTITPAPGNTGFTVDSQSFSITGTDPDNDQIRYGMDWNMNNIVDQWLPVTDYINSGTAQNVSRFFTAGTHTFQALTQDNKAGESTWTTHTVTITPPPTPVVWTAPATFTYLPKTAQLNSTVRQALQKPIEVWYRVFTTNPGACTETGGVRYPATGKDYGTAQLINDQYRIGGTLEAHTDYWYCAIARNEYGTTLGNVQPFTTYNTPPEATILTPGAAVTIAQGNPVSFAGEGTDGDNDPITAYEWDTSCAPGGINLSTNQNFTLNTNTLAAGTYTIYFMVRDNQGTWSECDTVPLSIMTAQINAPSCTIPPGSSTCTADITWTTQGVTAPSIRQDGTQFSTAGNQALPGTPRTLSQGSHTFTVLSGTTLLASDNADASCASGSTWNGTTCTGTAPTAPVITFDANPDSVPSGGQTTLEWTVTGTADACWARNNAGNNAWEGWKNVTGGTQQVTVTQNTTFYLECWNQGVSSGEKDAAVTISTGNPGDSTINAADCTIPTNQSTCNTLVTWAAVGITNPSIREDGTQFSTSIQSPGIGQVRTLSYGPNQFCISDGTTNVVCDTATAACPATAPWDNTKCAGTPPVSTGPTLRANPRVVDQGDPTTLTWTTGGVNENECVLKGGAFGPQGISLALDGDPLTGTIQTPVQGITTYTIVCPAGGAQASVTVEVRDKGFET